MSQTMDVRLPDMGDFDKVTVIEVLVAAGDAVEADQDLITLESDKASMGVPSPRAGVVKKLEVAVGDEVAPEALIAVLELAETASDEAASDEAASDESGDSAASDGAASDGAASGEPAEDTGDEPATRAPSRRPASADLETEVLVLGSGPGGYTAAFRAADLGKKVTLVERHSQLGGVCLNVGCIPSKALLHAAKVIDEAAAFAEHGLAFGPPEIDLEALRSWKDAVVRRLTGGLATMAKQREVRVVHGTGRFTSPNQLSIDTADGVRTLAFEAAIIAAGSRVTKLPGLPYEDPRLVDSTGALELRDIPERLLVIGGGIIGLEMATVYHALGSKITVVELMDGLIPGCDRDLVRPLHKRLEERFEGIHLETRVASLKAEKGGLRAVFEGEKAPEPGLYDRVLLAVGRRPNGSSVGAEAAGVRVDERGFIPVDRQMRTNVAHIYAIGDLVGPPMLAHKASHEGKVAAEVIAGEKSAFDARVIPSIAYTDPEVAWVGLSETEAKKEGIAYGLGTFPWSASGRSLGMGRSEGRTKLLFDEATGRVIGGGAVGPHAGDLVAEMALAIEMGCDAQDLGLTVHAHPTLSETVAFSAEAFAGTLTDLYLPKRKR